MIVVQCRAYRLPGTNSATTHSAQMIQHYLNFCTAYFIASNRRFYLLENCLSFHSFFFFYLQFILRLNVAHSRARLSLQAVPF